MTHDVDIALLAAALRPLIDRVRTDVTAVKRDGGRQAWTQEPLTPERLLKHLNGGPARGVSQISAGSSSTLVGLLDFDSHGGETPWPAMVSAARDVMISIELLGGAPVAFRSSGGRGLHVYCLWSEPQDAYSVREWLTSALRSCGYKSGTRGVSVNEIEVFPKQSEVPVGGYGNQAILPLSGQSVPMVFEPLLDDWIPGQRADALSLAWPMSDPVPVLEKPAPTMRPIGEITGFEELRALLAAIPNSGKHELGHDPWRDVMFIIHHETGGSEEGRALAHAFSAKSSKYDPDFQDSRTWPYIRSDRENVKGIGSLKRMAAEFGWHEEIVDGFDDISEGDNAPPVPATVWVGVDEGAAGGGVGIEQTFEGSALIGTVFTPRNEPGPMGTVIGDMTTPAAVDATLSGSMALVSHLPPPPEKTTPAVKRRGIPEAHYLTTDQANAQRLKDSFGSLVLVAAGKWHIWDGKRWVADESDVYRYGCRLSDIIRGEKKSHEAKADAEELAGNGAEATKLRAIAEALGKWAMKSEMKGAIEAAIGLARKMLTVDAESLDRDPWALNCLNGIVDLRTGKVRKHDPSEYITKIVPLRYRADAVAPTWEAVVGDIVGGDAEVASFLQRWAGYCLTGDTREQCFAVHWGGGSNGKSTIIDMLADTQGEYGTTAAPGLMAASKSDRHPTEIASLFGRRMVTAHEHGENVVLREDFIKQATGGDKLMARHMREDFFEFRPVHKLQLLTNHKPQIKGQDHGIWRRVLLVPYDVVFGTAAEVAAGLAHKVKDMATPVRLRAELEGVLAWRVRGSMEWAQGGLRAPEKVRAAGDAYKREQDRVGQFVAECCEVGMDFREALTDASLGSSAGLYPEYVRWCKDAGVFAISKPRFKDDVLRAVPGSVIFEYQSPANEGKRKKLRMVQGLRLLPE